MFKLSLLSLVWHSCSVKSQAKIWKSTRTNSTNSLWWLRIWLHDKIKKSGKSTIRSSHRRFSVRKDVLRNFAKFTGNTCARVLKKRLWHRCIPVNFATFLRTPFLHNTSGRLPLYNRSWDIKDIGFGSFQNFE